MHPHPNILLKSLILSFIRNLWRANSSFNFANSKHRDRSLSLSLSLPLSLSLLHTHFYILFKMCNSSNEIIEFCLLEEKLEMGFICYDLYVSGFLCNQHF